MSLYTVNPFETFPIARFGDCTAKIRITLRAQEFLSVPLLKRHQISQRTVAADLVRFDHNEKRAISGSAQSCGDILESEA